MRIMDLEHMNLMMRLVPLNLVGFGSHQPSLPSATLPRDKQQRKGKQSFLGVLKLNLNLWENPEGFLSVIIYLRVDDLRKDELPYWIRAISYPEEYDETTGYLIPIDK